LTYNDGISPARPPIFSLLQNPCVGVNLVPNPIGVFPSILRCCVFLSEVPIFPLCAGPLFTAILQIIEDLCSAPSPVNLALPPQQSPHLWARTISLDRRTFYGIPTLGGSSPPFLPLTPLFTGLHPQGRRLIKRVFGLFSFSGRDAATPPWFRSSL